MEPSWLNALASIFEFLALLEPGETSLASCSVPTRIWRARTRSVCFTLDASWSYIALISSSVIAGFTVWKKIGVAQRLRLVEREAALVFLGLGDAVLHRVLGDEMALDQILHDEGKAQLRRQVRQLAHDVVGRHRDFGGADLVAVDDGDDFVLARSCANTGDDKHKPMRGQRKISKVSGKQHRSHQLGFQSEGGFWSPNPATISLSGPNANAGLPLNSWHIDGKAPGLQVPQNHTWPGNCEAVWH